MVDGANCIGSSGNGSVNRKQLATIIRSEVLGAGVNALALLPGFMIGKAWQQAYERMRVASNKKFGAKSGRAKALLALPFAPALNAVWYVLTIAEHHTHSFAV